MYSHKVFRMAPVKAFHSILDFIAANLYFLQRISSINIISNEKISLKLPFELQKMSRRKEANVDRTV